MASVLKKTNLNDGDEDEGEDLEALRLAALMTLRKKSADPPPPPSSSVTFQPHFGNPNLIAIIPQGTEQVKPKPMGRQNFFRHPMHMGPRAPHQQYRPQGLATSTLKVLPQVPHPKEDQTSTSEEKEELEDNLEKEGVSTKFSRFEDTESESEDESENEKKSSDGSSDESDDVLALQDDDDSLEALMAQMEHEIEVGIDPEPNKKEKKKPKNNKAKEREQKSKTEEKNVLVPEKPKAETKTAIVEPTVKDVDNNKKKDEFNVIPQERAKSPVKIHPINIIGKGCNIEHMNNPSPIFKESDTPSLLLANQRSLTPPTRSPQREKIPITRPVISRSTSRSRSRSPIIKATSPSRLKSPRRLTPVKRSPDRYYSGKRSTSPYYKPRERDYVKRSRSPIRRRSLSPRRSAREASPRYYQRRSRSPWSPAYRRSPESPIRYRSPANRRSMSPKKKYSKPGYSSYSPTYRKSPKRKSPSLSPRRSKSPPRKREYSPQRRRSPRREFNYRKNSVSPKRKHSPPLKKYSPQRSPRRLQRSPSLRRNDSPRRRISPMALKEPRTKPEQRSRTPSLSLSLSPPREIKGQTRRYKSPLRSRKETVDMRSNRTARVRRPHSPDKSIDGEMKDKKKSNTKQWERERENRLWERKMEDRRKERGDRIGRDVRKDRENRLEKEKVEESIDEGPNSKVTNNPVFEARRKKFESTALVEPASKKIRLVSKKRSPIKDVTPVEKKQEPPIIEKQIVEHSVQTEDDLFSGQDELDEIDNFLNEDVLDLSAEVWDSDEDLLPKVNKASNRKTTNKVSTKQKYVKEKSSEKDKSGSRKVAAPEVPSLPEKRVTPSPPSPEPEREESDLRAELSRRREERLTKAGSLHEKLPARLLQSAFESALGKKKLKKEEKLPKTEKESKKRDKSPLAHKEKTDGRRVLVLKRTAPVKMQSAHINVTFPSRSKDYRTNAESESDSDSESSYSSSSTEEERYSAPKRKLPVYMRLGTTTHKRSDDRNMNLRSRRSQV